MFQHTYKAVDAISRLSSLLFICKGCSISNMMENSYSTQMCNRRQNKGQCCLFLYTIIMSGWGIYPNDIQVTESMMRRNQGSVFASSGRPPSAITVCGPCCSQRWTHCVPKWCRSTTSPCWECHLHPSLSLNPGTQWQTLLDISEASEMHFWHNEAMKVDVDANSDHLFLLSRN
jgi:hypothetical protein